MTVYECGKDILIVDCGMAFPDADMLGVDLVIPDFTYVEKNTDRIRGHGAHPRARGPHRRRCRICSRSSTFPIYGTRLTLGLIEGKLKEHGLLGKAKLNVVKPRRDVSSSGCMSVEFIHVNHSIPDAVRVCHHTPRRASIVHTGDFKVDYTPIDGEMIDLAPLCASWASRGCSVLLARLHQRRAPRLYRLSERKVGGLALNALSANGGDRRIIIATFSSNIHRIQQIVDAGGAIRPQGGGLRPQHGQRRGQRRSSWAI